MKALLLFAFAACLTICVPCVAQDTPSRNQLKRLLQRYPAADSNGDGRLTWKEADTYRKRMLSGQSGGKPKSGRGIQRQFKVDPGWDLDRFPEHAVSNKTPNEIKNLYQRVTSGQQPAVVSFKKPADGARRIVGV
ncbi:MAG: hypothetical protein AAF989_14035, partial [Planctomycetota bacterium]